METAGFEDVPVLTYPFPAPVAAGQRVRLGLWEMPGAAAGHRFGDSPGLPDALGGFILEDGFIRVPPVLPNTPCPANPFCFLL